MGLEDTEKISAGLDPVQSRAQLPVRKTRSDAPRDPVSSPTASVEDSPPEKIRDELRAVGVRSDSAPSGTQTTEEAAAGKPLSKSQLEEVTEGINREFAAFAHSIQFRIEEVEAKEAAGGKAEEGAAPTVNVQKKEIVVSVVDKRTGEVIRQIPPEELMQSLYNATTFLGILVDQVG